jgi:hypothetical protein
MEDQQPVSNDFSGNAENLVQAGAVHGGIHMYAARRSFPAPHQLPPRPTKFVNRKADLLDLDRLIDLVAREAEDPRADAIISAVAGPPGVGKTALALYWAHGVRNKFPDGDLYIDMHGYDSGFAVTPEGALDAFLRALSMPPEDIPEELDQRSSLFRSMLNGKRVIVIIDNASSSAQVRQLLPSSPQCCAVVTSRSSLQGLVAREGAMRVRLDLLSPEDSVQLLSELIGSNRVSAEPVAALRLAELCGRLPLALRVVAERVISRPLLSLRELVEELLVEQNRLDVLASSEDELSDTRAVFSWSYRALTPELRRAFRLLGLHASSEIATGGAAALIGISGPAASRELHALADVHLLQEISASRFRMHDLLRSYSMECALADQTQEERTQAIRRVLIWYLYASDAARRAILPYSAAVPLVPAGQVERIDRFGTAPEATQWLMTERLNLLAAMRQALELGQYDVAWKLAMASSSFFELCSYWSDWEENHRIGLEAALALGDPLARQPIRCC